MPEKPASSQVCERHGTPMYDVAFFHRRSGEYVQVPTCDECDKEDGPDEWLAVRGHEDAPIRRSDVELLIEQVHEARQRYLDRQQTDG